MSILVGSGFSIPEGLPGIQKLNKQLSKINESEIQIDSTQRAKFLKGQEDFNSHSGWYEKKFIQEFLEFYNTEILKPNNEDFHYETFYDYYTGFLINNEKDKRVESFCNRFNDKYFKDDQNSKDPIRWIFEFDKTFSQLLASQLKRSKYFDAESIKQHPPYDTFIGFLKDLIETCDIKFHTLNHDLFFDWLGQNHEDLKQYYSDGFQLEDSSFYGKAQCKIKSGNIVFEPHSVKLRYFTEKFDKPLSFFKLHGSIDNIIPNAIDSDNEILRIKTNYSVTRYQKKIGDHSFEELMEDVKPDFLSGTTNKIRFYNSDPYYKKLFEHFKINLLSSELLIVIGYGFQDDRINEFLETYFLSQGKNMIIIDPGKLKSDLFCKYNPLQIQKSIIDITYQEFLEQILLKFNIIQ